MLPFGHLRDQLLHHHIDHGAGRKAQGIGQRRYHEASQKNGEKRPDGLHYTGEDAIEEGLCPGIALCPEGHGEDGALRKVLNGNAQRERQSARHGDVSLSREPAGIDHAHRHALWQVVERHRQGEHGGTSQAAGHALGTVTALVEVGNKLVQQQQEQNAHPEADEGGHKRPFSHAGCLIHGGNQQAPDGGRHHHTGGKSRERALHRPVEAAAHKEDTAGAQGRPQEGNQKPLPDIEIHRLSS